MRSKCALLMLAAMFGFTVSVYAQSSEESDMEVLQATVRALQAENQLFKLRIRQLESRLGVPKAAETNIRIFPGTDIPVDLDLLREYTSIQKEVYDKASLRYVLTVKVKKDMNFQHVLAVMDYDLVLYDADGVALTRAHCDFQPAYVHRKARAGEMHRLTYQSISTKTLKKCTKMILEEED